MNNHLNVFRHYKETSWENNLTRALAITLLNNPLFFSNFFRKITGENFEERVDLYPNISIDSQVAIKNIQEDFEVVYPVALTTKDLDISNKNSLSTENPICDLIIIVDNICILVEVKISEEDCIAQLNNQVDVLIAASEEKGSEIERKDITSLKWDEIISIAEKVQSITKVFNSDSIILNQFIEYLGINYPSWFPVKDFYNISLPSSEHSKEKYEINKRLELLKSELTLNTGNHKNRTYISLDKPWASEVNLYLENEYICMGLWPGDTRTQGWSLFRMNPDVSFMELEEKSSVNYEYTVSPYFNFFGQSPISTYHIPKEDIKDLKFKDIFHNMTGRKKKDDWKVFSKDMDKLFPVEWKEKCSWNTKILNSNRTQFNASLGFAVICWIKYSHIQKLERENGLVKFLQKRKNEMVNSIENKG